MSCCCHWDVHQLSRRSIAWMSSSSSTQHPELDSARLAQQDQWLNPASYFRLIPLGFWSAWKRPLRQTTPGQNRGYGLWTEWPQRVSNLRINAGPGGRCCHSSASDCSGSKGVVTELSLSFCADELLLSGECVWIVNECLSQTKVAELLDDLATDKLRVLQSQARNA